MLTELREELKAYIGAAQLARLQIQRTRGRERYDAWRLKRHESDTRRHLHLAACYVRGTPYRKCEACPATPPQAFWIRDLLEQHGCREDPERTIDAWLDIPPVRQAKPEKPPCIERLYTVVRADLPPGSQGVQSAHAMREFAAKYPEIEKAWHERSNTLVMLAVPDEAALVRLRQELPSWLCVADFWEPDLDDALTAICVEPKGGRFLQGLAPMLREKADAA